MDRSNTKKSGIQYMKMSQMSEYTGIGKTYLKKYKREDPNFPKEIRISPRIILYRKEDVDAYIAYRQEAHKRAGA